MNPHDLDTIRADYRDKPDECFRELLSRWLKNDSKPTWPVLVSALKSPTVGFEMLSEQVKENLSMSTVGSNDERQSVKSKGNAHVLTSLIIISVRNGLVTTLRPLQ